MRKPLLLRLVGWLAIAAGATSALALYSYAHGYPTTPVALGVWLFGFAFIALAAVWAGGSLIVWILNRQARVSAAVIRDAVAGGGQRVIPRAAPVKAVMPTALPDSVVPACDSCGGAAVLHCCRHESNLCWPCVVKRDRDECTYIQSWRVVPSAVRAREQARARVATSPLSGAR